MKLYVILILCIFLIVFSLYRQVQFMDCHERMATMAQSAPEYGCYAEAKLTCPNFGDDIKIGECYDNALRDCPRVGSNFRKFIEGTQK
jgi:hypothetical protein